MHHLRGEPRLFKDKRGNYHAIFYDPDTRRRRWVSMETNLKRKADTRFRRLITAYERGEYDPWKDRAALTPISVEEAREKFVAAKQGQGRSASTIKGYREFLSMVSGMVPSGLLLRDLTMADCQRIINRPASNASRKTYYRNLRAFLNWSVAQGYILESPLGDIEAPHQTRRTPQFLTEGDLEHLLQVIKAYADGHAGIDAEGALVVHRAVRLAVSTGLRRGELLALRCGDVELAKGLLFVRNREGFRTKSGHDRAIPLSPMARSVYEEVGGHDRRQDELLLKAAFGSEIYPAWLSRRFKRFIRLAGLDEAIHWHTLRHTFCSWLAQRGVDPHRIKEWAGHSSLTVTEKYMHLAPERHAIVEEVFDYCNMERLAT